MTNGDANKIVRWFQKNLGLLGWEVIVKKGLPPGDKSNKDDESPPFGACIPDVPYHRATIWINGDAHAEWDGSMSDEAHTLMHELLHALHNDCMIVAEGAHAEWGVNQVASVLLRQYRADNV